MGLAVLPGVSALVGPIVFGQAPTSNELFRRLFSHVSRLGSEERRASDQVWRPRSHQRSVAYLWTGARLGPNRAAYA
jgi:hypothetical protein